MELLATLLSLAGIFLYLLDEEQVLRVAELESLCVCVCSPGGSKMMGVVRSNLPPLALPVESELLETVPVCGVDWACDVLLSLLLLFTVCEGTCAC